MCVCVTFSFFSAAAVSCISWRIMTSMLFYLLLVSVTGFQAAAAAPATTVQVRVGEDTTLRCPLLDGSNETSSFLSTTSPAPLAAPSTLSWYRKVAGQSPQMLLSIRSMGSTKVKYGPGVRPEKVAAAPDGSLLLRRSEQSDAAVYYCGVSHGDEQQKKKPTPQK